jgi:HD-GYP domain-containing protein (c-di-GMP phosphodiesterase class II)
VRDGWRLAAVVGALSVASDLGKGLADGQALSTCVLSVRLAQALDLPAADVEATFWVGLLRFVGCTATSSGMARALGDELAVGAAFATADARYMSDVLRGAGVASGGNPLRLARFLARAPHVVREHEVASCEVARLVAARLQLPAAVGDALFQVFERWDGRGNPGLAGGTALAAAVRVERVARIADLVTSAQGLPAAHRVLQAQAGSVLDPHVVGVFCANSAQLMPPPGGGGSLADLLAAEPQPHRLFGPAILHEALAVFGTVADLKSPFLAGHSGRVSDLAAAAATAAGLPPADVLALRRAGLVHDVGRVAVSSKVWDKPGRLAAGEWELVRLHPHHTGRVLDRVPELSRIAALAAAHHERPDGTGYPRGLNGAALGRSAAVLAAADTAAALGEARPHRPAVARSDRARIMREEVLANRLDGDAVESVLAALEEPRARPRHNADLLTLREREVLALVARGATNRQAGTKLGISAKTVNAHLEHVYRKLGVRSRAAAVFHGIQDGLVDPPAG